jgi:hypothetical protein
MLQATGALDPQPQAVDPLTAMPVMGVSEADTIDMSAYACEIATNDDTRPLQAGVTPTGGQQRSFLHRVALVNVMVIAFFLGLATIWFAADALLLILRASVRDPVVRRQPQGEHAAPIPRSVALAWWCALFAVIGGGGC